MPSLSKHTDIVNPDLYVTPPAGPRVSHGTAYELAGDVRNVDPDASHSPLRNITVFSGHSHPERLKKITFNRPVQMDVFNEAVQAVSRTQGYEDNVPTGN